MLLALLQYYGFRLSEHGRRLTVERGLLARWRTSASRRRIQAWTLREGVLHRLLKRRSLEVDTAVAEEGQQQRALRELAPIATPAACDALIEHLLPRAQWSQLAWQPLPRVELVAAVPADGAVRADRRPRCCALALRRVGPAGAAVAAVGGVQSRAGARSARPTRWATSVIAVREGWWSRHWRFAELDKLQALQLTRSPLDRRCGTATLWLDTGRRRRDGAAAARALPARGRGAGAVCAAGARRWRGGRCAGERSRGRGRAQGRQ